MTDTPRSPRGADALATTLIAAGVRRLFTLSGNHIMPVFDAALGAGIELIHVRHEAAAVHMADAWARLTGEVGVALVTGGPGHANAVSALYTAAMAESPVLLLSGHAPNGQRGMGAFQEMRQADVAAPLCKASDTVASPAELVGDLAKAIRTAGAGRPGPVHLSLPQDVLDPPAASASVPDTRDFQPPMQLLDASSAEALLAVLRAAKRPLIIAGPAACTATGRTRAAQLESATGVPVVGTESPRGVADPALGAFGEVLAQADAVLLLGKRLDFTLRFGKPPCFDTGCVFAQCDPESAEIDRARRAVGERLRAHAVADWAPAVDALVAVAKGSPRSDAGWCRSVREAVAYRPTQWRSATSKQVGRLHPAQALLPLQAILDESPDSVLVSDGGEIGQWAQACLSAPHRVVNGMAGSIGAGLPFALAARQAKPKAPVIAVMGDGTFGFHPAEIDTAVRHGLPFVCVVGNDERWNAEYQIQLRDYGPGRLVGCELLPTRYDQVAIAFGGHGEWVTRAEDLLPAARRAIASGKPAVLNVMVEGLAAPNIRRPTGT